MSNVFDENTPPTPPTPADQLIGEGKRYASVDVLAASKIEADRTIEQRNTELAELRAALAIEQAKREVLESLRQNPPAHQAEPAKAATAPVEEVDWSARIREEMARTRSEEKVQGNVETVGSKLIEIYGTQEKASEVVRQKAQELGVSVEFLQSVAAQSPKAFFTTVGIDQPALNAPSATHGNVNTAALGSSQVGVKQGSYAYYENIRKTNPTLYFSPKVQNELHAQARKLGDAFYG